MKTIVFGDHGQDFLEWDLDDDGVVVGCRPFQGSIWGGRQVTNHRTLEVDSYLRLEFEGSLRFLKYPLAEVRERP